MDARRSSSSTHGPDLLVRYLNVYLHTRELSELERPWGLGEAALDGLWARLAETLAAEPLQLSRVVAEELSEAERVRVVETLAPLIFALPLRSYPAELRATRVGPLLLLRLRHLPAGRKVSKSEQGECAALGPLPKTGTKRPRDEAAAGCVGYLPGTLTAAFVAYLRRVLDCGEKSRYAGVISSGGRRRRVRITMLARDRGVVVRFLERIESPVQQ